MEATISQLVTRYEGGTLSRRELIQALALMATAGATTAAAAPLPSGSINHTSVLVSDMDRSKEFYSRVFGLTPLNEDLENQISRLGVGNRVLVSLRVEPPAGRIDHFAIGVENFNRQTVTQELQAMGIEPQENLEFGFHILDPDGAPVQITGI